MNDRNLVLNYNDLAPFNFDSSLVESDGAAGLLKKINKTAQEFQQDFSSDVGFVYDSSLLEFDSGLLRKKDQTGANSVMAATYDSSYDANWNKDGSVTGVLNGSPSIINNELVCDGAEGVAYVGRMSDKMAMKTKYTPTNIAAGAPSTNVNIMGCYNGTEMMMLTHSPSGSPSNLRVWIKSTTGNVYTAIAMLPHWTPVQGQKYEILFTANSLTGEVEIFIDGVKLGGLATTPWTWSTDTTTMYVGANAINYNVAEGNFQDFIYFNDIVETADYTPGYSIANKIYSASKASLPQLSYTDIGNIQAWESLAATMVGDVKLIHNDLYYNVSTWSPSDGSEAQSNTLSEAQAEISSLPASNTLDVDAWFEESNDQQSIDLYRLFYTGQKYSNTDPYIEVITGQYLDGIGEFTINSIESASAFLMYILSVNSSLYYWDGAAWSPSDGSKAQANTLAQLNANISSFDFGTGKVFKLRPLLVSNDDNETAKLESVDMTYDFAVDPNYPNVCKMYGFITDNSSQPIEGAEIEFDSTDQYSGQNLVTRSVKATSDDTGYYEANLVKNLEMTQTVKYTQDGSDEEFTDSFLVPELDDAPISEHTI